MKKTLLYLLIFITNINLAQYTYVPDDNFEQALLNMGYDFVLDDYVETSIIDTVSYLYIVNQGITDLTGIEDFTQLSELFCNDNNLVSLNLASNEFLFEVICSNNNLTSLNLRNGNNSNLWYFMSFNNPSLICIDVDDIAWCEYNFAVDTWTTFNNNCSVSNLNSINKLEKKLTKIIGIDGKITLAKPNIPLLYIYNDGSTERKIFIE